MGEILNHSISPQIHWLVYESLNIDDRYVDEYIEKKEEKSILDIFKNEEATIL